MTDAQDTRSIVRNVIRAPSMFRNLGVVVSVGISLVSAASCAASTSVGDDAGTMGKRCATVTVLDSGWLNAPGAALDAGTSVTGGFASRDASSGAPTSRVSSSGNSFRDASSSDPAPSDASFSQPTSRVVTPEPYSDAAFTDATASDAVSLDAASSNAAYGDGTSNDSASSNPTTGDQTTNDTASGAPTSNVTTSGAPTTVEPISHEACCKVCRTGKACGDSCIAKDKACHGYGGCACDG